MAIATSRVGHRNCRHVKTLLIVSALGGAALSPNAADATVGLDLFISLTGVTGIQSSDPLGRPEVTRGTVNPDTSNSTQLLDLDIQGNEDRRFTTGTVPLSPTVFNAAAKMNNNASVNRARIMPLTLNEETIGQATQGTMDTKNGYVFANWQYVDKIVAWGGTSEHNVTSPGQAWIDAAHRNGVKIYGNVFIAPSVYGGRQSHLDYMLQKDANGDFIVADKLVEMATTDGFDGWFLNQELSTDQATAVKVGEFMDYIQANSDIEIIWYDAMTESGAVIWQDRLSTANDRFFQDNGQVVSDSMFLDFASNQLALRAQASRNLANQLGRSEFDLYAGATFQDLYISGADDQMNAALTSGAGGGPAVSVGMFRPDQDVFRDYRNSGWDIHTMIEQEQLLYSGARGDPSDTSTVVPGTDWRGVAHHIAAKSPLVRDRFIGNFNYGLGLDYYMNGEKVTTRDWVNIGAQDILPTWRWVVDTTDTTPVEVGFDFDNAYIGGSSLKISGRADAQTDIPLYLSDIFVQSDSRLALIYTTGDTDGTPLEAFVTLKGQENTIIPVSIPDPTNAGWNEVLVDLSGFQGETISSIGLRMGVDSTDRQINIGQIGVIRGERDVLESATNLRLQQQPFLIDNTNNIYEARLLWDHSSDYSDIAAENNLYYYNVYQEFADGTRNFLGVTAGEALYLDGLLREPGNDNAILIVEAVSLEFGVSESMAYLDWETGTLVIPEPSTGSLMHNFLFILAARKRALPGVEQTRSARP